MLGSKTQISSKTELLHVRLLKEHRLGVKQNYNMLGSKTQISSKTELLHVRL
jgi:hypothetical protein